MQIDGGWLTGIARDLMREGQHEKAAALLHDGLEGIQWEDVYAILRGEARLVGTNTMDLEPDKDPEHVEALQDVYGGRFRFQGEWWVPYKAVRYLGGYDARWSQKEGAYKPLHRLMGLSTATPRQESFARRISFYARPEDLIAECLPYLGVLCRPSQAPPVWLGIEDAPGPSPKAIAAWAVAWAERFGRLGEAEPLDIPRSPAPTEPAEEDAVQDLERTRAGARAAAQYAEEDERSARLEAEALQVRKTVLAESTMKVSLPYIDRAGNSRTVHIPKEPLDQWALARLGLGHLATPWNPVALDGFKMQGDSRYHSDWCCGATVEGKEDDPLHVLTDYADRFAGPSPIQDAAHNYAFELASNFRDYKAHILNVGKSGEGRVVQPEPGERVPPGSVVVLPHLGVEFSEVALCEPLAIIAGKGGPLAHLAVVGREKHLTILRIPGAASTFLIGMRVTLNAGTGEVVILEA